MVQLPTTAFSSLPAELKKCLPLPNGRSYVLMKLNTFGRSNGEYDFGWVRLYISCGYTWFCEKIWRYVSSASVFDRTYELVNCQLPKRRWTLMVVASYHVWPWPLLRDQTFRNCGKGRSDWARLPVSGKFAYGFLKPAATTADAVIGCCSKDPRNRNDGFTWFRSIVEF